MKPSVQVQYWKNKQLSGLEVSQVKESSHVFPPHFHEGIYSIGIMEKGATYCFEKGDETGLTMKGCVALINPGQVHTGIPMEEGKVAYSMIHLSEPLFRSLCLDITGKEKGWEFSRFLSKGAALRQNLLDLCRIIKNPDSVMQLETALFSALAFLIPESLGSRQEAFLPTGNKTMLLAAEKLRSDLTVGMKLEDLALECGMSRYHFLRSFKKSFGITPHVYRTQAKVDAAKTMILGGKTLSETALDSGFFDQSHFSRTFLNYLGATPAQYASAVCS